MVIPFQESMEINEKQSIDGHIDLDKFQPDKIIGLAKQRHPEQEFLVEQISLDRSSPPSFIPEVIALIFEYNILIHILKLVINVDNS